MPAPGCDDLPLRRGDDPVAALNQDLLSGLANVFFVIHHQDQLAGAGGNNRSSLAALLRGVSSCRREVDPEYAAASDLAVYRNESPVILHDGQRS